MLLAGAAGCFSYSLFPGKAIVPTADRLSPGTSAAQAMGSLLGQGHISDYYAPVPAPIVTATAKPPKVAHKPSPTHSPAPAASAGGTPAGGMLLSNAAGLGFYDGNSSPDGMKTAASWLGSPGTVKYAQDFIDATDWSHITNPWQLSNWQGSPYTMIWGVPMIPCGNPSTQCSTSESDYDAVANGSENDQFRTLAKNLISAGFGSSYIRIGWEFNGDWMGWSICNSDASALTSWAGDFVPAFRNIVTSMRSVGGANFKFIWNPDESSNATCPGASLENFYPGDSYVDDIALDVYDTVGAATSSDQVRWSDLLDGVNAGGWTAEEPAAINGQHFKGYGLNWLAAFARQHGKTVGLPEWGLNDSGQWGGGGDDSYFVTQMADWIKTYANGPQIFWNYGDGTLPLDIPSYTSGDTPNATAAFRSAFGVSG